MARAPQSESHLWSFYARIYSVRNLLFSRILNAEKKNLCDLANGVDTRGCGLDIGTGTGHTLDVLSQQNEIICLDQSPRMLKTVRSRCDNICIQGHAIELPFQDNTFSFVSAIGLSEYVPDLSLFCSEVCRVLCSGGYFLITAAPPNIWNRLRQALGHRLYLMPSAPLLETAGHMHLELQGKLNSLMQEQYLFKAI